MNPAWSILYRGPLSSCNYDCGYCPFAKTRNTREELIEDADCLTRFVEWVCGRQEDMRILFTPWGEALPHQHYQEALCVLSHLKNVKRVAIQTNLSCNLDWLASADPATVALWCTYHPTQTTMERFLAKCRELDSLCIRYSVGVVGTRDSFSILEALRACLPRHVYLWINAYKREPNYYSDHDIKMLTGLDPLFEWNNQRHQSLGQACRTGHTVFSVDGKGEMRRCHFIKTVIGNIYSDDFEKVLFPRHCSAETCGCHIGYVHLERLRLDRVFGYGLLERIPDHFPTGLTETKY